MKKTFFIALLLTEVLFGNGIQEKTESIIRSEFGSNVEISFKKYVIPKNLKEQIEQEAKQRFFSESVFIWEIEWGDSLLSIGLMDNVYGKAQPITFITFFTLDGKILSNHIVKYREQHGGEVAAKEWNEQFAEMAKNSDFTNIDGISGATISVNAIKKGVMKLTILFERVKNEL